MARFMCAAVVAVVLVAVVAPVMAYNNVWSVCMWQCLLRARHLTPCLMVLSTCRAWDARLSLDGTRTLSKATTL